MRDMCCGNQTPSRRASQEHVSLAEEVKCCFAVALNATAFEQSFLLTAQSKQVKPQGSCRPRQTRSHPCLSLMRASPSCYLRAGRCNAQVSRSMVVTKPLNPYRQNLCLNLTSWAPRKPQKLESPKRVYKDDLTSNTWKSMVPPRLSRQMI